MDEKRRNAASEVMQALGHPDFRARMRQITDEHGHHPMVMATHDDTVGSVFRRMDDHEAAFLVVPPPEDEDRGLEIVAMECAPNDDGDVDEVPVGVDTTVGMLLTYLRAYPGHYRIHVKDPHVSLALVDDGPSTSELLPS